MKKLCLGADLWYGWEETSYGNPIWNFACGPIICMHTVGNNCLDLEKVGKTKPAGPSASLSHSLGRWSLHRLGGICFVIVIIHCPGWFVFTCYEAATSHAFLAKGAQETLGSGWIQWKAEIWYFHSDKTCECQCRPSKLMNLVPPCPVIGLLQLVHLRGFQWWSLRSV